MACCDPLQKCLYELPNFGRMQHTIDMPPFSAPSMYEKYVERAIEPHLFGCGCVCVYARVCVCVHELFGGAVAAKCGINYVISILTFRV